MNNSDELQTWVRKLKSKLIPGLAIVMGTCLFGCSTTNHQNPAVSASAKQIVRQMCNYYENLDSFEGTNAIIEQSPTYTLTRTRQFAFLRPNRFLIQTADTNDSQLYCDGTDFYDYRPYYYNSYTKTPAPRRFEDAITNWIGGELLHLMVMTNRFPYLMDGFGRGLIALKNQGKEAVDGVACHHLLLEEGGLRSAELWIATGKSPRILKLVFHSPAMPPANGLRTHTEIISGWQANRAIPPAQFIFHPPPGAIAHPSNKDQVELTATFSNGIEHQEYKFIPANNMEATKQFLEKNTKRFQAVAFKAVLTKYANLTTNVLAFSKIEPAFPETLEKRFTVTFVLPATATTNITQSIITIHEEAVMVALDADGNVKSITRGSTSSISTSPPHKTK